MVRMLMGLGIAIGIQLLSYAQSSDNLRPPNIICILVDDLGFGDLSCQGATDMETPYIDSFARQGMTFSNFYANSTVCSPSRAALLTGRYPDMVGVPGVIRQVASDNWGYLNPEAILLPKVLKSKGYHSAIIGKWHLGLESPNVPNEKGFDFFKGFLGDMMDDYWTHRRGGINWMRENEQEIDPEGHATDLFTDWAIDYLKERKKEENPFFLYLAYNAPHFPIQPPQEWLEKVNNRDKNIDEKRAQNVAFVEHLDYSIGRFLEVLSELELDENTLVVFTSDNGGALRFSQSNGRLRGGKQDMYEGGIKVPTYMRWSGKVEPGSSTDNISLHMDLFATYCDVAGIDLYHEIDGISILPTLLGQEQDTDDRYIYWMRREGFVYGGQVYYAARYRDYKILQNTPYSPIQFFKISEDPYEQNELLTVDDDVYNLLRKKLQGHIRRSGAVPWQKR